MWKQAIRMQETRSYILTLDRVSKAVNKLPARAATEAVNFSKERFRAQNWIDNSTQPWEKRKVVKNESNRKSGRATLVDTGRLRRSIRKVRVSKTSAIIGTDVPYAEAHNDGYRGRVKQRVRAHTRTTIHGKVNVKTHSRVINLNLPRRRFIGNSAQLEKQITRMMTLEIRRAINV